VTIYYTHIASPIGPLLLIGDGTALTGLHMANGKHPVAIEAHWQHNSSVFAAAQDQLDAYFDNRLQVFDLALKPEGTAFQQRVWTALLDIPFGQVDSYGGLARRIGKPTASRAVGMANGRNPISIIVPCHRVIGADGSLTGYGGGIERKRWLLSHEGWLDKAPSSIAASAQQALF